MLTLSWDHLGPILAHLGTKIRCYKYINIYVCMYICIYTYTCKICKKSTKTGYPGEWDPWRGKTGHRHCKIRKFTKNRTKTTNFLIFRHGRNSGSPRVLYRVLNRDTLKSIQHRATSGCSGCFCWSHTPSSAGHGGGYIYIYTSMGPGHCCIWALGLFLMCMGARVTFCRSL